MQVYIEYVILDNLIINYLILFITQKTLGQKNNKWLNILSSALGTCFAVAMPFMKMPELVMITLKVLVGMIMCFIVKRKSSFKSYIISFLLFLTYTFVFGGVCFGILFMLNPNINVSQFIILGFETPISIYTTIVIIYIYLLIKAVNVVKHKRNTHKHTAEIIIKQNNSTYNVIAFLDTGNNISKNNEPVIVLNKTLFFKIFKNVSLTQVILNKLDNQVLPQLEYVTASGIGEDKTLPVFTLDSVSIKNKEKTAAKATVVLKDFSSEFDCIIHPNYFDA